MLDAPQPQGSELESFNLLGEFVNCYYTGVNCNKKGLTHI